MASVEVNQMLAAAAAASEDKKAEDIRILALDPAESGLADYFLICSGTNDRQTVAITDEIEIRLKRDFGTYPNSVEGRRQGEWILMDYVDFIVHVFLPERRAFYGLERLRVNATTLSVEDLNSEIKAAIQAKRPAAAKRAPPLKTAGTAATAKKVVAKTAVAKKAVAKKAIGKKTAGPSTRSATGTPAKKSSAKKVAGRKSVAKAPKTAVANKTATKAAAKKTASKAARKP